jgi:hypothetical protein
MCEFVYGRESAQNRAMIVPGPTVVVAGEEVRMVPRVLALTFELAIPECLVF